MKSNSWPPPQGDNDLLTVDELAAKLRVSDRTVERLAKAKTIPSFVIGRGRRYELKKVLAALHAQPQKRQRKKKKSA